MHLYNILDVEVLLRPSFFPYECKTMVRKYNIVNDWLHSAEHSTNTIFGHKRYYCYYYTSVYSNRSRA